MTDILQILEEIKMILFNIKDDTDLRIKMKETVRIFAGFCDKIPGLSYRIFPPIVFRMPPTEMVGSISAARSTSEIMEVVVVFP